MGAELHLLEHVRDLPFGPVHVGFLDQRRVLVLDVEAPPGPRFLQEAQRWCRIVHPNVLRVVAALPQPDESGVRLISQYPGDDSCTLAELLEARGEGNRRALTWPEVHTISHAITAGMAALHSMGVIHGQITAQNLIVSGSGEKVDTVLIANFGLTPVDTEPQPSHTIEPDIGSVVYMSIGASTAASASASDETRQEKEKEALPPPASPNPKKTKLSIAFGADVCAFGRLLCDLARAAAFPPPPGGIEPTQPDPPSSVPDLFWHDVVRPCFQDSPPTFEVLHALLEECRQEAMVEEERIVLRMMEIEAEQKLRGNRVLEWTQHARRVLPPREFPQEEFGVLCDKLQSGLQQQKAMMDWITSQLSPGARASVMPMDFAPVPQGSVRSLLVASRSSSARHVSSLLRLKPAASPLPLPLPIGREVLAASPVSTPSPPPALSAKRRSILPTVVQPVPEALVVQQAIPHTSHVPPVVAPPQPTAQPEAVEEFIALPSDVPDTSQPEPIDASIASTANAISSTAALEPNCEDSIPSVPETEAQPLLEAPPEGPKTEIAVSQQDTIYADHLTEVSGEEGSARQIIEEQCAKDWQRIAHRWPVAYLKVDEQAARQEVKNAESAAREVLRFLLTESAARRAILAQARKKAHEILHLFGGIASVVQYWNAVRARLRKEEKELRRKILAEQELLRLHLQGNHRWEWPKLLRMTKERQSVMNKEAFVRKSLLETEEIQRSVLHRLATAVQGRLQLQLQEVAARREVSQECDHDRSFVEFAQMLDRPRTRLLELVAMQQQKLFTEFQRTLDDAKNREVSGRGVLCKLAAVATKFKQMLQEEEQERSEITSNEARCRDWEGQWGTASRRFANARFTNRIRLQKLHQLKVAERDLVRIWTASKPAKKMQRPASVPLPTRPARLPSIQN